MPGFGLWAGAAGFALGLSLAGVYTADVASADSSRDDSAKSDSSVSAGPARGAAKTRMRPAPVRGPAAAGKSAASTVKPAASAGPAARPVIRSASSRRAGPVAGPSAEPTEPVTNPVSAAAEPTAGSGAESTAAAPSITIHNTSQAQPIWVYNLTETANYSIPDTPWKAEPEPPAPHLPPDWVGPVKIEPGSSTPVTLAVYNAPPKSPGNRIYIVEGSEFTLPVTSTSGVDPFDPTASPGGDSFRNYSFLEYSLYPADGGYQYTIDVSYIDEWSLPIQTKFTLNGARWNGAVNGKTYGFNDFDTVKSQLDAAGGPYGDLVWSGPTPWAPQPPPTVSRIIGPDKVWTAQSTEPAVNFTMNKTGWVPESYQKFVQYGAHVDPATRKTVYPYSFNGTGVSCPPASCTVKASTPTNFNFWKYQVSAPGSTPYPIALRTAAILDGFTTADAKGVYGFFTYPDDEAAGQFTNIPTAVSLDVYVDGSSDGVSDSAIPGGQWYYTSSSAQNWTRRLMLRTQPSLSATDATDTYIVNHAFRLGRQAPLIDVDGPGGDIAVIDRFTLGATSTTIDIVDRARFLCGGLSNLNSQFVYEQSTGTLYFDRFPNLLGYTAVLARFPDGVDDPAGTLFVL